MEGTTLLVAGISAAIIAICGAGVFIVWIMVRHRKSSNGLETILAQAPGVITQLAGLLSMAVEAMNTAQRMKIQGSDYQDRLDKRRGEGHYEPVEAGRAVGKTHRTDDPM